MVRATKTRTRVNTDDDELVRLYLFDIGQYKLLAKDEEVWLAQEIELGAVARSEIDKEDGSIDCKRRRELLELEDRGIRAQSVFVKSNLRLVVSIAKKFQSSGLPLLDLIQEGNLGLIHAVEKFEWRKGFRFSTYATWWIKQYIARSIANTGRVIRLPVHVGDMVVRVQKAQTYLEFKLGRQATLAELAQEVGVSEGKIVEVLRIQAEPVSLSVPLCPEGDAELVELVEDKSLDSPCDIVANGTLPTEIDRLLSALDKRERQVLIMRFGLDRDEPRTLEQVAKHFDLTRERIRQIEVRATSKLRHPSTATGARDLVIL